VNQVKKEVNSGVNFTKQTGHEHQVNFAKDVGPGKSTALLSTFCNGFSAPTSAFRPNVMLACYQQAGSGGKQKVH
jgi:hypothetical protein